MKQRPEIFNQLVGVHLIFREKGSHQLSIGKRNEDQLYIGIHSDNGLGFSEYFFGLRGDAEDQS